MLIDNAKITANGISGFSNENGEFNIKMPVHLRKPEQIIRTEHQDYKTDETEHNNVESELEIRLENK